MFEMPAATGLACCLSQPECPSPAIGSIQLEEEGACWGVGVGEGMACNYDATGLSTPVKMYWGQV